MQVRCDGKYNTCSNCERLGFECSLSALTSDRVPVSIRNASLSRPPRRRARMACRSCKSQKVKCSATLPSCSKCKQRGFTCVYLSPRRVTQASAGGLPARAQSADVESILEVPLPAEELAPTPGSASPRTPVSVRHDASHLSSADQKSLETASKSDCRCMDRLGIFPAASSPSMATDVAHVLLHKPPGASPAQPGSNINHRLAALVESFFHEEYPLPSYSFLHPESTVAKCHVGTLDPCLSLALAGVATLHISICLQAGKSAHNTGFVPQNEDDATTHSLNCTCHGLMPVQAAEQLIWSSIENPTISRLQALLLCINHYMHIGRFQRAFMLAALAARFAAALRLHREHHGLDFVAQETRRRIVWSLKLVERYFSIGLPEFELCPFESIYIQPPCVESAYDAGSTQETSLEDPSSPSPLEDDYGAYQLCVHLESLRRDIVKLGRAFNHCERISPQISSLIRSFERTLFDIGAKMPHGPELSFDQINALIPSRWLPRHIALQLSWHQCHCDLYRLLLRGYPEAAPRPALEALSQQGTNDHDETGCNDILLRAERHCLHHANAIILILTMVNQQSPRSCLLEFDATICAYHATRLLFFISRFGRDLKARPSEEFAASRLELCLAALRRFFPQSKLVEPIIAEMENTRHTLTTLTPRSASRAPASEMNEKLAVHSLLRLARFSDRDDVDGGNGNLAAATAARTQNSSIFPPRDASGPARTTPRWTEGGDDQVASYNPPTENRPFTASDGLSGQSMIVQDLSVDALTEALITAQDGGPPMGQDWDFTSFMPLQAWEMPNHFISWLDVADNSCPQE